MQITFLKKKSVTEVFSLLWYYTLQADSYFLMFYNSLRLPSSRVKLLKKNAKQLVVPLLHKGRCG